MLYYSIDHPDPDNNFTVTVVPINGAGPGEPAFKSLKFHTPTKGDDFCLMHTVHCNFSYLDSITASHVSVEFTSVLYTSHYGTQ